MAKRAFPPILSLLIAVLALAGTGCQQQQQEPPLVVLPPPDFSPPTIYQPAPLPRAVTPQAKAPSAPPRSGGALPLGWLPPVAPRNWLCIIVHHSATPAGGAAAFDKAHRAKGWDELGYDFVIGNGTDTGDGQIEVGPRWTKQKWGAHDKTPDNYYNEHGIGICLVGDFDVQRPTAAQLHSLTRLCAYLMRTYHISAAHIYGHGETKSTDCPGKYLSMSEVRRIAGQTVLAENHAEHTPALAAAPDGELLYHVK